MRSDALARRTRLIETACTLFRSDPNTIPLETIADKAQVGIATLYRNFPDRASLINACSAHLFNQVISCTTDAITRIEETPTKAREIFDQWTYELVDMGLPTIVPAFAPDDPDSLPADVATLRVLTRRTGEKLFTKAHRLNLVDEDICFEAFILGLLTVARPPVPGVVAVVPDITAKLVSIYLRGATPPFSA